MSAASSPSPPPLRDLLITAGPTREPLDAVRFLSNRSSGALGIALADEAASRGLSATLLLGPVCAQPKAHSHLRIERFQTAADLQRLLAAHWPHHRALIMAAAVSDYRPAGGERTGKMKRGEGELVLRLEPTPDLLAEAASSKRSDQLVVGFALESSAHLEAAAGEKLRRKRLDAIVANPLETMDATTVTATLRLADGQVRRPPPELPKPAFAAWLLDQVAALSPPARVDRG